MRCVKQRVRVCDIGIKVDKGRINHKSIECHILTTLKGNIFQNGRPDNKVTIVKYAINIRNINIFKHFHVHYLCSIFFIFIICVSTFGFLFLTIYYCLRDICYGATIYTLDDSLVVFINYTIILCI